MIGNFLGHFEKPHSYVKTALATFWATFGKIGLLFTPPYGHTGERETEKDKAKSSLRSPRRNFITKRSVGLTIICCQNQKRRFQGQTSCFDKN